MLNAFDADESVIVRSAISGPRAPIGRCVFPG